jgi:biotin synthase-related radical SAM superfamily protein
VLLEEPEYFGPHILCRAACKRFRALGEVLLEERDSAHGQIAALAREVQAAIEAGVLSRAIEPFAFLEEVLQEPRLHSEVENAVAISFVVLSELRASNLGAQLLVEAERAAPLVISILVAEEPHQS